MTTAQFNASVQAEIRLLIAKAEAEYESEQQRDEYTPGFCEWFSRKLESTHTPCQKQNE